MTTDSEVVADSTQPPRPGTRFLAGVTVALAIVVALSVVYWYRAVFAPLLLAVALAYILEPMVQWLMRKGCARIWAVTILLVSLALVSLSSLGWLAFETVSFVDAVTGEVKEGLAEGGKLVEGLTEFFNWVHTRLGDDFQTELSQELTKKEFWQGKTEIVLGILQTSFRSMLVSIELVMLGVLMPIYLFYLMLDLARIWTWIRTHLPAVHREHTLQVLAQLHTGMSAFLRGRVIISFLKGVLTAIGLLFCGTPMAIVVGLTAGFLSIVPFLGPALGFTIALALTLSEQMSVTNMILVVVVFAVAEVVENFVLTPVVMKQGADLHPLTIVFCVVFWGSVFGAFGALVAIPLTLTVKVLFQEYVMPSVRSIAALE